MTVAVLVSLLLIQCFLHSQDVLFHSSFFDLKLVKGRDSQCISKIFFFLTLKKS